MFWLVYVNVSSVSREVVVRNAAATRFACVEAGNLHNGIRMWLKPRSGTLALRVVLARLTVPLGIRVLDYV